MFPALYHAHHSEYNQDIPFWIDLAARSCLSSKAPAPILELGCGTGRVLSALVQAGYHVYGLDNDFQMLMFLRQNLGAKGLTGPGAPGAGPDSTRPAEIFQADLTCFRLAKRFSLILLACNTYSTLSPKERAAALSCIYQHLQPGGVFAASLPNPQLLKRIPNRADEEVEQVFSHPVDGEPVQVSSAWERDGNQFCVLWHYDHLQPNGNVERLNVEVRHFLTPASTFLDEMRQAGFRSFTLFGGFDRSAFKRDSDQLIILAK